MKIVGVKHQTGEFNNKPYDNYRIYYVDETKQDNDGMTFGICPTYAKVRASVLHEVCAPDKVNKLIQREVNFFYDAYKNVVKMEVL